jgi:tetratricopeptide (TPR) repeat protein
MTRSLGIALLLFASTLSAQISEGDRAWANRAAGSQNGRAMAEPVNSAIAAYQRAVTAEPNNLEARFKLLRAYRFKGAYVAATNDQKKAVYGEAKKAGADAIKVVDRALNVTSKSTEKQVADAARAVPGAAEVYLWDAINWGEWALAYGKLAAAREGAADRIRRQATIALLVNPGIEGGTPARVLGRLHDQTPRIPFITGWASGREAVKFLNESLKLDPANKITIVFLAEAMASSDDKTKPQAIAMLRNAISTPVDPEFVVEQTAALNDARVLLKKLGG